MSASEPKQAQLVYGERRMTFTSCACDITKRGDDI